MDKLKIIPYMRIDGIWTYKDSEIGAFYNKVWTDGIGETVFFDGSIKDADHFVQLMKSPHNYLHIIYYREKLVGLAWINRIERTNANCHWVFFREWWGLPVIYEIGDAVLRYLIEQYDFKVIYGLTPTFNKLAIRYLKRLGLADLGVLPYMLWHERDQKPIDARLMYITREILECRLNPTSRKLI